MDTSEWDRDPLFIYTPPDTITVAPEAWAFGLRTLDLFLTALGAHTGGKLPNNFVVMLPKLVSAQQVKTLVEMFEHFEGEGSPGKFAPRALRMEFMVETTPSVMMSKASFTRSGMTPLGSR